jgi:hypothetical protein
MRIFIGRLPERREKNKWKPDGRGERENDEQRFVEMVHAISCNF